MTTINFRHLHELLNQRKIAAMHVWLDVLEAHHAGKLMHGIRYRFRSIDDTRDVAEIWIDPQNHINMRMLTDRVDDVIVWTPEGVRPRKVMEVEP